MYFYDFSAFDTPSEWCFSSHQDRIKIASRSHQDRIKIAPRSHSFASRCVANVIRTYNSKNARKFQIQKYVSSQWGSDRRAGEALHFENCHQRHRNMETRNFSKCTDTPRNFCHATKSARCIGCVEKFLKRTDTPRNFCHSTKGARCIRCVKNFSMCTDTP